MNRLLKWPGRHILLWSRWSCSDLICLESVSAADAQRSHRLAPIIRAKGPPKLPEQRHGDQKSGSFHDMKFNRRRLHPSRTNPCPACRDAEHTCGSEPPARRRILANDAGHRDTSSRRSPSLPTKLNMDKLETSIALLKHETLSISSWDG